MLRRHCHRLLLADDRFWYAAFAGTAAVAVGAATNAAATSPATANAFASSAVTLDAAAASAASVVGVCGAYRPLRSPHT